MTTERTASNDPIAYQAFLIHENRKEPSVFKGTLGAPSVENRGSNPSSDANWLREPGQDTQSLPATCLCI